MSILITLGEKQRATLEIRIPPPFQPRTSVDTQTTHHQRSFSWLPPTHTLLAMGHSLSFLCFCSFLPNPSPVSTESQNIAPGGRQGCESNSRRLSASVGLGRWQLKWGGQPARFPALLRGRRGRRASMNWPGAERVLGAKAQTPQPISLCCRLATPVWQLRSAAVGVVLPEHRQALHRLRLAGLPVIRSAV